MKRVWSFVLLGALISVPSGYGLFRLVTETLPYLKERWFFYFLVFLFLCGLSLPIIALLNRYFFAARTIMPKQVVRESIAVGFVADFLLWLKIGDVLSPAILILTVCGFSAAELLLRTREKVETRSDLQEDGLEE